MGLVYVAAFAPNSGQSAAELNAAFPPTPGGAEFRPDASGFLKLTTKGISDDFAADLTAPEKDEIATTQAPLAIAAITGKVTKTAWEAKPSFYIVAIQYRMIAPEL